MFRPKGTSAAKWFEQFVKIQDEMKPHRDHEQDMMLRHAPRCYADFGKCMSCGCDRPALVACVSHHNSNAYLADVNKRLIAALEKPLG